MAWNQQNQSCVQRTLKADYLYRFSDYFFSLYLFHIFTALFFSMFFFLALQNKKYSNSDFITKNLCNIVFGFPFGSIALHCKWEKTSSHVNTWIVMPEYACMRELGGFFWTKVFTWCVCVFFSLSQLLSTDRLFGCARAHLFASVRKSDNKQHI